MHPSHWLICAQARAAAAAADAARSAALAADADLFSALEIKEKKQREPVWKSSSELGYHAIEQTRLRGQLRVGGVET